MIQTSPQGQVLLPLCSFLKVVFIDTESFLWGFLSYFALSMVPAIFQQLAATQFSHYIKDQIMPEKTIYGNVEITNEPGASKTILTCLKATQVQAWRSHKVNLSGFY